MNKSTENRPGLPGLFRPATTGNEFVGVAVLGLLDGVTFWGAHVLGAAIDAEMDRAGVHCISIGGAVWPTHAIRIFEVQHRAPALECLLGAMNAWKLLPLAVISYFDTAELYWRNVGGLPRGDFEMLLTRPGKLETSHLEEVLKNLERPASEPPPTQK